MITEQTEDHVKKISSLHTEAKTLDGMILDLCKPEGERCFSIYSNGENYRIDNDMPQRRGRLAAYLMSEKAILQGRLQEEVTELKELFG